MAHTITTQTLVDGPKNKVIKVNIKGDGSSGELSAVVLYDSSAYTEDTTYNKLTRIQYCLNSFSAELFWAATSPVPLISLVKDHAEDNDYSAYKMGGIINNGAAGRTGDITITTNGLNASTNDGYILFYVEQRQIPRRV